MFCRKYLNSYYAPSTFQSTFTVSVNKIKISAFIELTLQLAEISDSIYIYNYIYESLCLHNIRANCIIYSKMINATKDSRGGYTVRRGGWRRRRDTRLKAVTAGGFLKELMFEQRLQEAK